MKRLLTYLLFATAMIIAGCSESFDDSKIWEELNSMQSQIDNLNGSTIPSIDKQIESIESSIEDLESVSATLKQQISELEESDEATSEQVTILKAKDAELEQSISALRDYVNTLNQGTKDWAAATFATLEQYNTLATELANLKEMLENYNNEVATNLANAISALETSMKSWVIEQLSGYYTIAQIDAKITTLEGSITEGDKALLEEIATLMSSLETLRDEVTAAYKSAIEEAITINNGVIDTKIATEIATINARINSEIATLNSKITALQAQVDKNSADIAKLLARIQSVSYIPTYSDGKATMIYNELGSRATLDFEISPKSAVTELSELWSDVLSVKGVATMTRAPKFIDMPIIEFSADTDGGTISVTISGENLPQEYFNGTQTASVALAISDGNNSIISEYVPMIGKAMEQQNNQIFYKSADGNFVLPYEKDVFGDGVTFESNTYNEEFDMWIMDFSADITSVGKGAFKDCLNLTEILLPESVTSLGYSSFSGCTNLFKIEIPESVSSIGDFAFRYCSNLREIYIPEGAISLGRTIFGDCVNLTRVNLPKAITAIPSSLFQRCNSLTEITIPDGVTSIGNGAFSNTSLHSIDIPQGVTTIGSNAFNGCENLTSIVLPEGITTLESGLFYHCTNLKEVNIPSGVTKINSMVFSTCTNLENIIIPDGVEFIGMSAFSNCKSLKSLVIPDSVTEIEMTAIRGCTSLQNIILGSGCVKLGSDIFNNSTGEILVKCNIPNATSADESMFNGANFSKIVIDEGVTAIGNCAFADYPIETDIHILGDIESFGDGAFVNCAGKLFINCDIPNSTNGAFSRANFSEVTLGDDVTSIGTFAFNCCSSLANITIPDSVNTIGEMAFNRCKALTEITIPNSVKEIGWHAFAGCDKLANVTLGNGITTIEKNIFRDCISLTKIDIPNSVTKINTQAFNGCTNLSDITIPNSVTSIGFQAFMKCENLTDITIPESVTQIGDKLFSNCTKPITLYLKPLVPPACTTNILSWDNAPNIKIYVPMESVDEYKAADGWYAYSASIVGYNF